MPGPVSDSFDPEFGTAANAAEISEALAGLYCRVSEILQHEDPVYILQLVREREERNRDLPATLTEWEWRIIRFALERATDSI